MDNTVGRECIRSAQSRLDVLGLTSHVVAGSFDYESGKHGSSELLTQTGGQIDAIICANDLMAIGVLDAARQDFGLDVPGDLSVVGFDGVGSDNGRAIG